MKQLKSELNEIIEWIEKVENKKMEDIVMISTIRNKRWLTEEEWEELTPRELRIRELIYIHRRINKVINLIEERNEIYETALSYMIQDETENNEQRNEIYELTLAYMLQDETSIIEIMKNELKRKFYYGIGKSEDQNLLKELSTVINWIEEEQEKFKL